MVFYYSFKIFFSVSLVFIDLIMICLGMAFFEFTLFVVSWAFSFYKFIYFPKFGRFYSLFFPHSFLYLCLIFWDSSNTNGTSFDVFPLVFKVWFLFFWLIFSVLQMRSFLFSHSLIFPSVISILPLILSSDFFISDIFFSSKIPI